MNYNITEKGLTEKINYNVTPIIYDELDSTNTQAKNLAAKGAKEGTLIIAKKQTCGRGRMGRQFFSPEKTGLYLSLILKPNIKHTELIKITAIAAVAVVEALQELGSIEPKIKWVNDVFVNDKKVAGILCESAFEGEKTIYSVLGMGINVVTPENDFPADLKNIAGAAFYKDDNICFEDIIAKVINKFWGYYANINDSLIVKKYNDYLMLKNKTISYIFKGEKKTAKALDVDKDYKLRVTDGKKEELLFWGEVELQK